MTTIAVMQPYFFPYAGYFRLFAQADMVVIFDCVQFPRRGWVHRNRLLTASGAPGWLTLPLEKCSQLTPIDEMHLSTGVEGRVRKQISRFPALARGIGRDLLLDTLPRNTDTLLVEYLERSLAETAATLGVPFKTVRSSRLRIDPVLMGEERIIAIVRALGGDVYLNPPGGRALYTPARFEEAGIELRFLDDYEGLAWSILQRLGTEPLDALKREFSPSRLAA